MTTLRQMPKRECLPDLRELTPKEKIELQSCLSAWRAVEKIYARKHPHDRGFIVTRNNSRNDLLRVF